MKHRIDLCVYNNGYTCAMVFQLDRHVTSNDGITSNYSSPYNRITGASLVRILRIFNKTGVLIRQYGNVNYTCIIFEA